MIFAYSMARLPYIRISLSAVLEHDWLRDSRRHLGILVVYQYSSTVGRYLYTISTYSPFYPMCTGSIIGTKLGANELPCGSP